MDKKIQALIDYLNNEEDAELTIKDIKVEENGLSYRGAEYYTPFGTFNVLTDEEADEAMVEYQKNLWDDIGLDSFTEYAQEYIINNCIDADDLEDYMREDYESYYADIESESDSNFENRLQQELAKIDGFDAIDVDEINNIKVEIEEIEDEINDLENELEDLQNDKESLEEELNDLEEKYSNLEKSEDYEESANDFTDLENQIDKKQSDLDDLTNEIEDLEDNISELKNDLFDIEEELENNEFNKWLENYEDNKDELIEKAIQNIIDKYDNPVEWYIDNFGKNSFEDLIKSGELGITVDFEKIADFCANEDGRGHSLSSWDGKELEQDGLFIYKIDNYKYDFKKDEEKEFDYE